MSESVADDLREAEDFLEEIRQAQKRAKDWHLQGDGITRLYRGEGDNTNRGSDSYKILWQITETQRPKIYSQPPEPSIQRRFMEKDDITREAAEILEKCVSYSMECPGHEFDTAMDAAVSDFLLPGRGQVRIAYDVDFEDILLEEGDNGEPDRTESRKKPGTEKVYSEYVYWKDFMHSDGRIWETDVWWVAFGTSMTRQQLVDEFGESVGNDVTLISDMDENDQKLWKHHETREDVARVWEFWNKRTKKVYKVAEAHPSFLEKAVDDPLKLQDFFPCPRPMDMVETPGNLKPIAEYKMYEGQANTLYRLTQRINFLVDWAKISGWFDTDLGEEISRVVKSPEGGLKAVTNFNRFRDAGGARGVIEWFPIEQIVSAIQLLSQQLEIEKNRIYEIVGLSDIMRGIAKPRVTKGAQQLEAQFAAGRSSRIGKKQRKAERFARDILRLEAEIIAEMFEPETMFTMSGLEPTPEVQQSMGDVIKLLRSEKMRNYRIDVETDSTVEADDTKRKEELNEFMPAFTGAMQGMFQLVQTGAFDPESAKEILMAIVRTYGFGRDLEEQIEQGLSQKPQQKPDPKQEEAKMKAQIEQAKLKQAEQELQVKVAIAMKELALKEAELQMDGQVEMAKLMQKQREALIKLQITIENAKGGSR